MFANRRKFIVPAAFLMLGGAAVILPFTSGSAAEYGDAPAPILAYDTNFDQTLPEAAPAPAPAVAAEAAPAAVAVDSRELECMTKVVHHESRGQPRRGQVAVAKVLVNRLKDGRFGQSICAVAAQPGQFFNVAAYNPRRDTSDWDVAEDVSRDVLAGEADDQVAAGALFFRASYAQPNSFFRSRRHVATVGAHIFYR